MSDEMKTETEEMHYPYVVRGATMYCSCGTHTRKLDMPASHGSYIRDKAMMNRTDCRSETKDGIDIKIEDTKDLLQVTDEDGNPVEVPLPIEGKLCEPELAKEWADAQEETLVDGEPALTVKCTITCKYGGVIGFMDAGQGVY